MTTPPTLTPSQKDAEQVVAPAPGRERTRLARVDGVFTLIEYALTYVVATFLVGFAVLSLVNTALLVEDPIMREHDYTKAITVGFDTVFLTIILLEVLHTVLSRSTLTRQIQEFLAIGITSGVRHGLAIAASGSGTHQEARRICSTILKARRTCNVVMVSVPNGSSQQVVNELAVNAGGVLLLIVALWLIRRQRGDD